MFQQPRRSSVSSLFGSRATHRRPSRRGRHGKPQQTGLERLEGRRVMALDFVAAFPNFGQFITDGATLREAPQQITIRFSPGARIDPTTLGAISLVRAGGDGGFGNGSDVNMTPTGFVGIVAVDEFPNENQVVIRFAENLPDDLYRLSITGGLQTLPNLPAVPAESFRNGGRLDLNFRLDLGAQVVSVVPQPITRQPNGSLDQARNTVVVHFNENDPLLEASAETVGNYRLVEIDPVTGDDVAVRLPSGVNYEAAVVNGRRVSRATLTFDSDLGDKLYRLQIGGGDDDNNTRQKATVVGSLFQQPGVTPAYVTNSVIGDGLNGRNDVDLYKIALTAGAALTVRVTPDAVLNAALRVFDASGTQVAILPSTGPGTVGTLNYTAALAGEFFVGVSSEGNAGYLPIDGTGATGGTTRGGYRLELSSDALPAATDGNSSFGTATALGVLGVAGTALNAQIDVRPSVPTALGNLLFPTQPGTVDEPGHREIPLSVETHGMPGSALLEAAAAGVVPYNFQTNYGTGTQGGALVNLITEAQKQRAREIFDILSAASGLRFVETAASGLIVATGDIRAVDPTAPVPNGPAGIAGLNAANQPIVVMNGSLDWGQSQFGGAWYSVAMHEILHALGVGHSYDIPSLMGDENPAESVIPGDYDLIHLNVLHPKNGSDVDTYSFTLEADGKVSLETVVSRPGQPVTSLADTVLELYRQDPATGARTLVARNDDFYGRDSFIGIDLEARNPGGSGYTYYVTVASTGTTFDANVENSGNGGRTDGNYQLRLGFVPAAAALNTVVDATNTPIDGDRDGRAGGTFNFWFQSSTAANTVYVDKAAPAPAGGPADGSLARPFTTVEAGLAAAGAGRKVVRIVGNSQGAQARPYLIGTTLAGEPLADGADFVVPENVTVMIDEGAVFKLRAQVIDVGSASTLVSRRGAALQVLGTPGNQVRFTSYHDDAIGGDSDGVGPAVSGGQWGGIVMRADSDSATKKVFLNTVSQADLQYGGGQVFVNGQDQSFAPIHLETSRPSLVFNTIRFSAGAALSADPNSFEETAHRRGPVVRGNRLTDNSINGMFVRIRTNFGQPIDTLDVPAVFASRDVTYVLTENLLISGGAGGYETRLLQATGTLTQNSDWIDVTDVGGLAPNMGVSGLGVPAGALIAEIDSSNRRIRLTQQAAQSGVGVALTIDTGIAYSRGAGRLQIDPGVVVKLQGGRIELGRGNAQFFAEGDPQNRVIFTSASDNRFGAGGTFDVFGTQVSQPAAGDWGGIVVNASAQASIDNAYIAFGGGQTSIEGGFDRFNVIEVHQGRLRLANSRLENNANGQAGSSRAGRGTNASATVFARGAQPVIVGNDFRRNAGAVLSINVNALSEQQLPDPGRSTGAIARYAQYDDNSGPLVRANTLAAGTSGAIGGMVVRGGEITVEGVWDDTDIVHVVTSEIVVDNFHTATGLRLMSSPNASLVVKFSGPAAGLTATGHGTDIDDRIGGTVHVLGQPGYPVVLTSLADDSVGASLDVLGVTVKDTNGDGPSMGKAGDWRGLRFLPYSNDRNVAVTREAEKTYTGGVDANRLPTTAQYLGVLAPTEKGGDDNRRLGFEVHGTISGDDTTDVDVYSFDGYAGSEVWIDIDKTSAALDTMVELLDGSGRVLARSVDGQTDSLLSGGVTGVRGIGQSLQKNPALGLDFYSQNPRDPGMRVILPGTVLVPAQTTQYFVRVRSQPRVAATATPAALEAAVSDAARVKQGATNGRYELRLRLQQRDEKPGSTVRYADIRFPVVGIDVQGLPRSSPLLGENGEAGANETLATAQYLGNLLATDRNTISVAGALSSATDVDWYAVDLTYEDIQVIGGLSNNPKTWSTVFDIDYADGIRGDLTLSVFDAQGRLMFVGRDSDLTQGGAPDRPAPGQGNGLDDLSKGSAGELDPFIGSVQMPAGFPGATQRYYVAVSSNELLPNVLDGTFRNSATNSFVRLEPIPSIRRVVEDHIGFTGYNSGNDFTGSDTLDYNYIAPYSGPVFSLPNLAQQVSGVSIDGLQFYLSEEPPPGTKAVATKAADLMMRSDGWLYRYVAVTGAPNNVDTVGELSRTSIVGGGGLIGRDNIPDSPPRQTLQEQNLAPTNTEVVVTGTTFRLSTTNVSARTPLIRETLTGVVQYSASVVPGQPAVTGTWSFTTAANGVVTFTPVGAVDPNLQSPVSGTVTVQGLITITWSANVTITRTGILANPTLASVSYQTVPDPNSVTTDRADAMAWRRSAGSATAFDRLFYSVRDIDPNGRETGVSRLYRAREATGDATFGVVPAGQGPNYGRVGTVIQTAGNDLGLTTGMAFIGQTLYGVDDRGHLFTIDQSTGVATLIGDVGTGGLNLQGLAVGPQNMQGGPDGAAGFFADKLFAVDRDGWMYCFDTTGTLLTELQGRTTDRRYVGRVDDSGNPIPGFFTGLAFSPVDVNLWRATNVRGGDAGHGVMVTLDNTRDGGFTNNLPTRPPESRGDVSIYYGFDTSGGSAVDGSKIGQLGVVGKTWAGDLASNIGTSIASVPAPRSVWFLRTTTAANSQLVSVDSPNDTRNLRVGMTVTGPGIAGPTAADPEPTVIVAIRDSSTIVLSRPATAFGTGSLVRFEGDALSITTQPFSLQGYTYGDKPTLYFNYRIDAAASLGVDLSTDGGQTWTTIAAMSGTRSTIDTADATLPAFASVSSRIGGQPNQLVQELFRGTGWRQVRIDIGQFHGASDIRLRFDVAGGGEGVYIDDIIVGFAERGEIVTGAPANQSGFFTIGTPVSRTTPQQNLQGAYQLEIRRGTEVGRLQSDTAFGGVKLDPVDPTQPDRTSSIFDTHGGLVRGIANDNASSVNEGSEFRGDDNVPRQQGQFIIESNSIVSASTFGIRIDAAAREAGTNAPMPGVVRNLPVLNANRLVPGVVVVNNIVSTSGEAGILFSGDPNTSAGALAAVPFGRIVNNTIYGGTTARGVGVDVRENAAPTLLNNVFANLATGVNVDASSAPVTVVGTSAFFNVGAQVTGVAQDRPIVLTGNPFVNAAGGNFYPVSRTALIDSSLDVLQERAAYAAVIAPLGIPVSPIITPARDLYGQLRADDPSQPNAPGLGGNVFKDRGAVERVDFTQPSASLAVPLDNGPADTAPTVNNVVRLTGADAEGLTQIVLQLNDVGAGIDKATVTSQAFTLRRDGVPLVENRDYVFRYLETSNRVVFEAAAVFVSGSYELVVNQESVGGVMVNMLADLAGNRLLPNNGDGTTSFSIVMVGLPGAPLNLQGAPASGQVTLTWSPPTETGGSNIIDYVVEYSTNGEDWTRVSDGINPATGATVTALTNGTGYFFRVAAVSEVGQGPFVQTSAAITPSVPAPAPVSLSATRGNTFVTLAWSAPTGSGFGTIADYRVEYRVQGTTPWTNFADGVSATTGATVTGLTNDTPYEFRVTTISQFGAGLSDTRVATPESAPAPVGLTATRGNTQVSLAWTAPTGSWFGTITDYRVEYRAQGTTPWLSFADGVSTTTGATVTGLTNGTTYEFRVTTITQPLVGGPENVAGLSAAVTATPEAAPAPVGLAATRGSTRVILAWTAPTGDWFGAITDYRVEYRVQGTTQWSSFADGTTATPGATVTGLTNGTAYEFRVTTITGNGPGASALASATPLAAPAPVNLSATAGDRQTVLAWTAPVTAPNFSTISDYRIEFSSDGGTTWTTFDDGQTSVPGATVTGLTNGVAYRFRVTSLTQDGAGESASETATPIGRPLAPRGLTLAARPQSIAASWATATAAETGGLPITDYQIEYSSNGGGSWIVFPDGLGTAVETTITALVNGTPYLVRVAARNALGLGAYTTSAVAAVPQALPGAPTRLTGRAGNGVVDLVWTAPVAPAGTIITDYVIQASTNGGASWIVMNDGVSAATRATVAVPVSGIGYVFRVAARTGAGRGAFTAPTATLTPILLTAVPAAPTALSAARTARGSVRLTWTAPPSNGGGPVNGYVIQYRLATSTTWTSVTVTSTAQAQTVSRLRAGSAYVFRVAARNLAGVGTFSQQVTAIA